MKRLKYLLAAGIAAVSLCACGDGEATEPGTGVYVAKTGSAMGIEMSVEDVFEEGFKLDLRDNGKGRIYVDGEDARFKWTLDGTDFSGEGGGAELSGTMKDGVIELHDVMGTGIDMKLVCDEIAGNAGDTAGDSGNAYADSTLLERLKGVKNGDTVYGASVDASAEEEMPVDVSEEVADATAGEEAVDVEDYTAEDEYGASFAGDWEGMTFIYDSSGTTKTAKMGKTGIKADSVYGTYARIWFDDDGLPRMDMVSIVELPEMNYTIDSVAFDEAGDTLYCEGKCFGGEFSSVISAPEENGVLTFSGRTNGDIKSNYVVYLKRLDSEWDRNDAPMISDKEYNIYITNNMPNLKGMTLEERVAKYKEAGVEVDMSEFLEPKP